LRCGARVWGVFTGSDSGICAENDAGHLVMQRNLIEYPRGGANDWESGHPSGTQAVTLIDSRSGNVIRYNTIRSTDAGPTATRTLTATSSRTVGTTPSRAKGPT
jgi:hypothetical protein